MLKQLLPEYTARPEFRDLFFREAKISATLDHANIVHTFDLVESDESLFIVMEYVRGVDLRTIVRRAKLRRRELVARRRRCTSRWRCWRASPTRTPAGRRAAPRWRIIHRDVSPSNILCSVAGRGEAVRLRHRQGRRRTRRSSIACAARSATCRPSRRATSRSITAPISTRVAVCLYEALTAERLFVGDLEHAGRRHLRAADRAALAEARRAADRARRRPGDGARAQSRGSLPGRDRLRGRAARRSPTATGFCFSAPQLGEHLRHILGRDPAQWLSDDKARPSRRSLDAEDPGEGAEGKEASVNRRRRGGANLYVVSGSDMVSPGDACLPRSEVRPPSAESVRPNGSANRRGRRATTTTRRHAPIRSARCRGRRTPIDDPDPRRRGRRRPSPTIARAEPERSSPMPRARRRRHRVTPNIAPSDHAAAAARAARHAAAAAARLAVRRIPADARAAAVRRRGSSSPARRPRRCRLPSAPPCRPRPRRRRGPARRPAAGPGGYLGRRTQPAPCAPPARRAASVDHEPRGLQLQRVGVQPDRPASNLAARRAQTVDFGRDTAPVMVMRRSGPPGPGDADRARSAPRSAAPSWLSW